MCACGIIISLNYVLCAMKMNQADNRYKIMPGHKKLYLNHAGSLELDDKAREN